MQPSSIWRGNPRQGTDSRLYRLNYAQLPGRLWENTSLRVNFLAQGRITISLLLGEPLFAMQRVNVFARLHG